MLLKIDALQLKVFILTDKSIILDQSIIRDINNPFRQTGGLKLMSGNLGKGVIKTSALKNPDKVIKFGTRALRLNLFIYFQLKLPRGSLRL